MFATFHGAWPRVSATGVDLAALEALVEAGEADRAQLDAAVEALVSEVLAAQEDAGLELVTDGQVRWPDLTEAVIDAHWNARDLGLVEAWRATAAGTTLAVAQAVPGPYTIGRRMQPRFDAEQRKLPTIAIARKLGRELVALAEAGCPVVMVEEPAAVTIGTDEEERLLFGAAQRLLLEFVPELHSMLVVAGGSANEATAEVILSAAYRSYLFDLIAGPDNWYLAREVAGDAGLVCGALDPKVKADETPTLVWAASYASSINDRGPARVGLANGPSLVDLSPDAAGTAIRRLGRAAELASMPPEEAIAAGLDRRTFSQPPTIRPPRRPRG